VCICTLFRAYSREQGLLSRDHHDQKIKARKQKTGIRKYSFVNGTSKLWNTLPARVLATLCCGSHIFKERVRKVIISEVM
jgi:hypothetical protein